MRQIVLDTETTGLSAERGHRIIEIGAIELIERRRSGREFHRYVDPEREIDAGALEVHGITAEFLRGKPRFADVAAEFLAFIDGAELVIHNAAFDVAFLDAELERLGAGRVVERARVVDTLALARERWPGQKNSLDALCKRLEVDNSHRELHGALLDAALLADVYLAMTAGQGALAFAAELAAGEVRRIARPAASLAGLRIPLRRASAAERESHAARLAAIDKASKGSCLWSRLEAPAAEAVAA